MGTYKFEKQVLDGKEYMLMNKDLFSDFFGELMSYKKDADQELAEYVKLQFEEAKMIRRKRIRLKREKIALTVMYNMMMASTKVKQVK